MRNFLLSSSIGKKLVMSLSGAFLVLFLVFHLAMNITVVFSEVAYNEIAAFLGANWYALVGTAVLAGGVVVHILMGVLLTWHNYRARGQEKLRRYAIEKRLAGVSWSSRNMFVLGLVVAGGLLLHLYNFWYNMQFQEVIGNHVNRFGHHPTDGAALIRELFASPIFSAIYLLWFAAIWLHLTHGFWSMFQSVGLANAKWYPRLKAISNMFVTVLILGYVAITIFFYIKSI